MTHGQNDTRYNDAKAEVRDLARSQASGSRAITVLYGKLLHWSHEGIIDSGTGKKGGKDYIAEMYGEYAKAHVQKLGGVPKDQDKKSVAAQASKGRLFAKVGEMTTLGMGGPPAQLDRFHEAFKKLAEADEDAVRSESNAMIKWATEQLKNSDQPLNDEALEACIRKAEKEEPTVAEYIEATMKRLEKVINGEAPCGKCIEAPIVAAHEQLRGFLQMVTQKQEREELLAKAAELGLTVVQEAAE